jgi:hypothetical protein
MTSALTVTRHLDKPGETLDLFIAILSAHRGISQAISVPDMAGRLGYGREKAGQRKAQMVKAAAVEAGHLIGSSCGQSHGWFVPATQEEIESTTRQYRNRVKSLCILIARTRAAASLSDVMHQLALEFEQESRCPSPTA